MTDKSYVTLEQKVCAVCTKRFDSGALLLDRRLRPTFEHHTLTGWGLCPECAKLKDEGYIALVGIDPSKSGVTDPAGSTVDPSNAYRTGRVVHLRATVWDRVFTEPAPPKGVAFVDDAVITQLEQLQKET